MSSHSFQALQKLITELRDPKEGCAWTREQDFMSLAPQTIEEVYELQEAILKQDPVLIREELGDLLYHLVFYAELGREKGWFEFEDIANVMLAKHHERMPSASDRQSMNAKETNLHWQQSKRRKRQEQDLFDNIPEHLPAHFEAFQLQERAADVGFDWPNAEKVLDKLREEIQEIEEEMDSLDQKHLQDECGDLLFAMVNLVRKLGGHPESALASTNSRFRQRLNVIAQTIKSQSKQWQDFSLEELENLWQQAKKHLL